MYEMLKVRGKPDLYGGAAFGVQWKGLMPSLRNAWNSEAYDEDKRINRKLYEKSAMALAASDQSTPIPPLRLRAVLTEATSALNSIAEHAQAAVRVLVGHQTKTPDLSAMISEWNGLVAKLNPLVIGPGNVGMSDEDTNALHSLVSNTLLQPLEALQVASMKKRYPSDYAVLSKDIGKNILSQVQAKYYKAVPYKATRLRTAAQKSQFELDEPDTPEQSSSVFGPIYDPVIRQPQGQPVEGIMPHPPANVYGAPAAPAVMRRPQTLTQITSNAPPGPTPGAAAVMRRPQTSTQITSNAPPGAPPTPPQSNLALEYYNKEIERIISTLKLQIQQLPPTLQKTINSSQSVKEWNGKNTRNKEFITKHPNTTMQGIRDALIEMENEADAIIDPHKSPASSPAQPQTVSSAQSPAGPAQSPASTVFLTPTSQSQTSPASSLASTASSASSPASPVTPPKWGELDIGARLQILGTVLDSKPAKKLRQTFVKFSDKSADVNEIQKMTEPLNELAALIVQQTPNVEFPKKFGAAQVLNVWLEDKRVQHMGQPYLKFLGYGRWTDSVSKKGYGRWTDYSGPSPDVVPFNGARPKMRGGNYRDTPSSTTENRNSKYSSNALDFDDEDNDPNELGDVAQKDEMIGGEMREAHLDPDWKGLPKRWGIERRIPKLRKGYTNPKEKY